MNAYGVDTICVKAGITDALNVEYKSEPSCELPRFKVGDLAKIRQIGQIPYLLILAKAHQNPPGIDIKATK